MKQRHCVASGSQSRVILSAGWWESQLCPLFTYTYNIPPAKTFHGCKQTPYITWPAQSLRPQRAEDILMRHIRCENRGAPEQGAKCHDESCSAPWKQLLDHSHITTKLPKQVHSRDPAEFTTPELSKNHLLSFSASHSYKKRRKSFSKSSLNLALLQKDPPAEITVQDS